MNTRSFEEYLSTGVVKRITPDKPRARALIKEAEEKKKFFELVLTKLTPAQITPNFIIDTCYDILIELIRAKMLTAGYASDKSHEAEVAYLRKINTAEKDVTFMNELRYYRNGIKYYGKRLDLEYAQKVLTFTQEKYTQLHRIMNS